MDWLNYHHLYYFWQVARLGGVGKAAEELGLAQPTVSAQLRELERSLRQQLFERQGRHLALTDAGRTVFRYAEEIFALGQELQGVLRGLPRQRTLRFVVGVADVLSKLLVFRLLAPAVRLPEPVQLLCEEGPLPRLLAALALHEVDLVLADRPVPPGTGVKAFSHLLGESALAVCGTPALVRKHGKDFPEGLHQAPFLLPSEQSVAAASLRRWFAVHDLVPDIRGEFADSALLKVFGSAGVGLFAVPEVMVREVERQYGVVPAGRIADVREQFYAITVERRLKHPAVVAVVEAARQELFGDAPR